MKKQIFNSLLLLTFLNLNIFASGIDSSSTPKTAYLKDTHPISGIHYQCNNGGVLNKTGSDGIFTYNNTCSEITFTLNNKVTLGKVSVVNIPSDYKLYLTDLAGKQRIDTNNTHVKNLATLLQSLDSDENPKNGIDINSSNINSVSNIINANLHDLQNILAIQYPTRTLISQNCALVHLEEVLRDDGFYVDTVPPCQPRLAFEIVATSNDNTYIELSGEKNSKIYLNGLDTNLTLDSDGKYYEFYLNTPAKRGFLDTFIINLKDNTTSNPLSATLTLPILKDTDQPLITNFSSDNNITISTIPSEGIDFNTTDDSITKGLTVSYEILGTHASEFEIQDKGVFTSTTGIKSQIWNLTLKSNAITTRPLYIQIKVKDKANHYDIKSLTITN